MSGTLEFLERHAADTGGKRVFGLRSRRKHGSVSLMVNLEFFPRLGLWRVIRLTYVGTHPYTAFERNTIMEIEGTSDKPPIDLALATLSLMGY